MPILQDLPHPDAFTAVLDRILGSEAEGTGVAGARGLLEAIDPERLTGSLTARLDGNVAATLTVDADGLTADARRHLQSVLQSMPSDPQQLIGPLATPLRELERLSGPELEALVGGALAGLQSLRAALPTDRLALLEAAREGLLGLRFELVDGPFGDLREWSELVGQVAAELEPILADGAGTVQDRMVAYLEGKVAALVGSILPGLDGPAARVGAALEAALPAGRVAEIQALTNELVARIEAARVQFEGGDLASTVALDAAQATLSELVAALDRIHAGLDAVFALDGATAERLVALLDARFAALAETEFVDLADVRATFGGAIARVEQAVRALELERIQAAIQEVFDRLREAIDGAQLDRALPQIEGVRAEIEAANALLHAEVFAVLATVRDQFTRMRDALTAAAAQLGSFAPDGSFRFGLQTEFEAFLQGVRTHLTDTVRPLLAEFEGAVAGTVEDAADVLGTAQGEIASVRADLESALREVADDLEALDVEAELERIASRTEEILERFGEVDFQAVVDPVVAELDAMAAKLREIDVAALGEISVGALKVSVEVVLRVDFSTQITDALMQEIDAVLELPRDALAQLEASVETALQQFARLSPTVLLAPLEAAFEPIRARLAALRSEVLLAPLDAWHARLQGELAKVSPAALLQPVVELHERLSAAVDAIAPSALTEPLEQAVAGLGAQLPALDLAGARAQLAGSLEAVRRQLDALAPDELLEPLVQPFDKIEEAMASFRPSALLEPVTAFFAAIADPLAGLTPAHVARIQQALAPLAALTATLDPGQAFPALRQSYGAALDRLGEIRMGGILAALQAPHVSMQASFTAGGGDDPAVSASIEALHPLRNDDLSRLTAGFEGLRQRMRAAFPEGQPPGPLVARYQEALPKLTVLAPSWLGTDLTPQAIRAAVGRANPLGVGDELDALWQGVRDQVGALDPRIVQENLQATYDALRGVIDALDPAPAIDALEGVVADLRGTLAGLDLEILTTELAALADGVRATLAALDPRSVVEGLDALTAEVVGVAESLEPSTVLSGLAAPMTAAREVAEAFDPAGLVAPLEAVFARIREVLGRIDLGIVLGPLVARLETLRSELEDALRRTETAFNAMLRAIPV
jgi:hypothetical protein